MSELTYKQTTSWRGAAIAGYAIIISTFGVVGGWAAVTEIDRAVIASAYVAVESNRKVVQHYEGGIVREILVKDGQSVNEGDVLFRLEDVQAKASMDVAQNQLDALLVLEARLAAELEERDRITWPQELGDRVNTPVLARAMVDQEAQFNERRNSLAGQVKIYQSRIDQLRTTMEGIAIQKESTEKQVEYINQELVGLRELRAKNLIPLNRLMSMERERTRLEGVIGSAIADYGKSENAIGEARLQIEQLRQRFREEASGALQDVRQKLADGREKLTVARDVMRRVEITAPRSGNVQALKVFTVGQVIRSGEALLEIVPEDERLVVHAQFSPNDIDSVHTGQQAEIRFPAFHAHQTPLMLGKLEHVSRDRLVDEATKQPYYLGMISVNKIDIPQELQDRLRAGMPAEVIVSSGERTVLSYLTSPLKDAARLSFTEK